VYVVCSGKLPLFIEGSIFIGMSQKDTDIYTYLGSGTDGKADPKISRVEDPIPHSCNVRTVDNVPTDYLIHMN
jgi:hypothetical protein